MKILNFGSCNIDYVYTLDHIVNPGETQTSHKLEIFAGGKGLNQSIAIARAGAEVYHAGCIGEDGNFLIETLKENGVNVDYLKKVDCKNGHAIIQVSTSGENSIFIMQDSNERVDKEYIDQVLSKFEKGDFIVLQNEISNVEYIIDRANEKGMVIFLNPSPFNQRIKKSFFEKIDYALINEVEASQISGKDNIEESVKYLKEKYPKLKVVMTLGKNGSVYFDEEVEIWQPTYRVEVVDTTAAGDTFTGYFVRGIAQGESCKNAIKMASLGSAISVSKKGATPSIPCLSEVMQKIKELKPLSVKEESKTLKEELYEYIEKDLKKANLRELSKKLGYTESYLTVLIKRETGKRFTDLLQEKRCQKAIELIRKTDKSIAEIISSVGYENQSFFRKMLKNTYGKKPLDIRKERKNNE